MPRKKKYLKRKKYNKKRGYKKKKMYKKKKCILTLPRQIIPSRAFVVHKFVKYIRIPSRFASGTVPPTAVAANWGLPGWGIVPDVDSDPVPNNTLWISCNSPMTPMNESGTPIVLPPNTFVPGPETPAFLNSFDAIGNPLLLSQALFDGTPLSGGNVPPVGAPTGYSNRFPSFWNKMTTWYNNYTVVGSKVNIKFSPDQLIPLTERNLQHCVFTMGTVKDRALSGKAQQPQFLQETPGFFSREYVGVRPEYGGKPYVFSMTKKWSARKGMGLSKGNIIGNDAISGNYGGLPKSYLTGEEYQNSVPREENAAFDDQWAQYPRHQNYFTFSCNSALTNNTTPGAYEPSKYPSGLFKVTIEYSTVWHRPRITDNEVE